MLTTPLTYIATANTILHTGAEPVFAGMDPVTGNLDPQATRKALAENKDIKALIVVHLYGQMADMKALSTREGIRDILDRRFAHCVEGKRDEVRPGQLSDVCRVQFLRNQKYDLRRRCNRNHNQSLLERIRPRGFMEWTPMPWTKEKTASTDTGT